MSLFKQNLPVPVGGVSQVPAEVRGPGFADDMVNAFPVSAKGLGVRQPTTPVASGMADVDTDSIHVAEINPSDDEKYLAIIDKNGVRVVDAVTGRVATVNTDAGLAAFLASGKFTSAAVGDDLFVASRGYSKAQLTGSPVPVQQNGALVTILSGQPSTLYRITLDGIKIEVRTPDDPPPAVKRPAVGLTVNTGNPAAMNMSVFDTALQIEPSQTVQTLVSFARTGYAGPINVSITSVDPQISASLASTSLDTNEDSTMLSISSPSAGELGTFSVELLATGNDVPNETITISVTVVAVGTGGGGGSTPALFDITPGSQTINITRGSSGVVAWGIIRDDGFTSDVTVEQLFTYTGISMPSDFTSGNSIDSTFNVASNVAIGTYVVTIQFEAPGSHNVTRQVTINVNANGEEIEWSPNNNTEVYTGGQEVGSMPLFIDWLNGFTGDVTVTFTFQGPIGAVTVTPSTLVFGSDDHVTVSWDLTGASSGDYTVSLTASAAGSPDVATSLTIHHTAP